MTFLGKFWDRFRRPRACNHPLPPEARTDRWLYFHKGIAAGTYTGSDEKEWQMVETWEEANLVSSEVGSGAKHSPVLDIDFPARLVPSSTPGHFHLYLEGLEIDWDTYQDLLLALAKAGVVEDGYTAASIKRRATFVRKPGVYKEPLIRRNSDPDISVNPSDPVGPEESPMEGSTTTYSNVDEIHLFSGEFAWRVDDDSVWIRALPDGEWRPLHGATISGEHISFSLEDTEQFTSEVASVREFVAITQRATQEPGTPF